LLDAYDKRLNRIDARNHSSGEGLHHSEDVCERARQTAFARFDRLLKGSADTLKIEEFRFTWVGADIGRVGVNRRGLAPNRASEILTTPRLLTWKLHHLRQNIPQQKRTEQPLRAAPFFGDPLPT
jgi:hypothetical protein